MEMPYSGLIVTELLIKEIIMDCFYQVINNEAAGGNIQHTLADMTIKCGFAARFVDSVVFQRAMVCSFTSPFFASIFNTQMLVYYNPFWL